MKKSHLAEAPPGVWVAHIWSDTITVAVAWCTLGEAVVSWSTAITLPPTDSRFATTKIQSQIQLLRRQVQLYALTSSADVSVVSFHSLALSSEVVTVRLCDIFDSSRRAFAAIAA